MEKDDLLRTLQSSSTEEGLLFDSDLVNLILDLFLLVKKACKTDSIFN
jgi:hypothetical protein